MKKKKFLNGKGRTKGMHKLLSQCNGHSLVSLHVICMRAGTPYLRIAFAFHRSY